MSLGRCIPEMLNDGRIDQRQAERLRGLYTELEADLSTKFGAQVADAMASEEAVRRFEAEALHKRRQAALQITAQQRIASDVRGFRDDNPGAAAVALLTHDSRAPYSNVERRADAIEGQAHALVNGILERHSRGVLGRVRNAASLLNVVREAFGEHTEDAPAKELADAWSQAAEMLRLRFNAAGGGIGKLEKWGMPQVHNQMAVRAAPYEQWRDFIAPRLDRSRMLDQGTGMPMTAQGLEMALRGAYDTITTGGWNTRSLGAAGAGKLANRHADSRFLVFKDADAWLEYSQRFGRPMSRLGQAIDPEGPIFDAMMSHIRGMSSDIALMERLGPNPAATARWVKDGLEAEAMRSQHAGSKRIEQAKKAKMQFDDIYGELSGRGNGLDNKLARTFGALRSWQSAAKLGSATLSAITDVGFQHTTRRFNGIPAANTLLGYVRMLKPGSAADRALATRLWMTSEEAAKSMSAHSRWTGEAMTGELASRLSEGVMRISGLTAWTQAGRWAFGREFWSHITDQATKNWDNINSPFRQQLERYGFSAADWDTVRSTPHSDVDGAKWILPENIPDRRLAERLAEMVATEIDYAVPQASIRVTAGFNNTLRRGTWVGEIARSALLFKSFPITVMLMHGRRAFEQQGMNRLSYPASLIISTTLLGALAWQLKAIAAGKDPEPMDQLNEHEVLGHKVHTPDFWFQAMAQGGGFGIMGDFVKSATSRFDNDVYSSLAGPAITMLSDALNVVKSSHKARALQKLIQSNIPGSSLWYTRLALQREILDQIQMQIDSDYSKAFGRMEKRAQESNSSYWWHPGERAPERAPDMENSVSRN
jgi:hypothetical protein